MTGRSSFGTLIVGLAALGAFASRPLAAQLQSPYPRGVQWSGRLDAIGSRAPTVQAGASANVVAGLYVRLEGTLAAGIATRHGDTYAAGRGDVVARFVLDPFGESRRTLYGIGGVSLMYDGDERWRPRLLAGVGIEGRPSHGRVTALEVALGGGVRVGIVVRRARPRGR